MKKRLLSLIICLALFCSFAAAFAPSASALNAWIYLHPRNDLNDMDKYTIEEIEVNKSLGDKLYTPTRAGCEFVKWTYYAPAGVSEWGSESTITADTTFHADIHVYAIYTAEVSFNANGGTGTMASEKPFSDTNYKLPACTFIKEGSEFMGWSTTSDGTVEYYAGQEVLVTKAVTFYAVWSGEDSVKVTFDANGQGTAPEARMVKAGNTVSAPADMSVEGYSFTGWYKDKACSQKWDFAKDKVTENMTLYAGWVKKPIVTLIDTSDNSEYSFAVEPGETAGDYIGYMYAEEGYIFGGWFTEAAFQNEFDVHTVPITEDITLYAKWNVLEETEVTAVALTITAPTAGKTPEDINATVSFALTPADAEIDRWEADWYKCETKSSNGDDWAYMEDDEEFESGWYYAPDFYVYLKGGCCCPDRPVVSLLAAAEGAENDITYRYYFSENTKATVNGDEPDTTFGEFYESPYEGYISYMFYVAETAKVSFDVNGHGTAPADQTVNIGETAKKPAAPTAEGYVFGGWFTDKGCTKSYKFTEKVTEDITLYARWTPVEVPPTGDGDGILFWSLMMAASAAALCWLAFGYKKREN